MILVTGANGLIGRRICGRLRHAGHVVRTFDIATDPKQDVRSPAALAAALTGVAGIVHLAAVSRVVHAQRDPDRAWAVNVVAFEALVTAAMAMPVRPWLVFSSSREVYGEPAALPVTEAAALAPLNIYARSKVAGENLVRAAAADNMAANVARFSNVFGCTEDHADRVVPAFAQVAAFGGTLKIEGAENMFDFTHVDDVARGLHLLIDATAAGARLDPVQFVTGCGTTLNDLASLAVEVGGSAVRQEHRPPRTYDVARFRGDPRRAKHVLGWSAEIDLRTGFERLAADYAQRTQRLAAVG